MEENKKIHDHHEHNIRPYRLTLLYALLKKSDNSNVFRTTNVWKRGGRLPTPPPPCKFNIKILDHLMN